MIAVLSCSLNLHAYNSFWNHHAYNKAASLMAQGVKNPPAMQATGVLSLGWEDPLEKEMTAHSTILTWRIPWTDAESDTT